MDFWAVCRDFAIHDTELDGFIAQSNRAVVLQDVNALNLIETRLGDTWDPVEVSLKIDTGGLAARRVLREMVASELASAGTGAAAAWGRDLRRSAQTSGPEMKPLNG